MGASAGKESIGNDETHAVEEYLAQINLDGGDTDALTQFDSAHKVLAIPKLLEPILLELPLGELDRSKRVSKTFKATSDNSILIKKALYLAPGEGRHHVDGGRIFNPFFLNKDSNIIFNVRGINFMFQFPMKIPIKGGTIKVDIWRAGADEMRPPHRWTRFKGSWQNMYISRPPWDVMFKYEEVRERHSGRVKYEEMGQRRRVKSPTMGELFEAVCDGYELAQ